METALAILCTAIEGFEVEVYGDEGVLEGIVKTVTREGIVVKASQTHTIPFDKLTDWNVTAGRVDLYL
jgi:hypothetical protein